MIGARDPTIIAGIMGLIGALLGAIIGGTIGGTATVFAAFRQHRVENEAKIASAVTSVLSELLIHQPTLYIDLYICLPLWLSRMHLDDTKKRKLEVELKNLCRLSIYDTRVFDARFSDLMTSRYGENIRHYYTNIQYLNKLSKDFSQNGLPSCDFFDYINNIRLSIQSADNLISELLVTFKDIIAKKWKCEHFFRYDKEKQKNALELAYLSYTNLDHINRYVEGGFREASLIYVLKVLSSEELNNHGSVIAARKIH